MGLLSVVIDNRQDDWVKQLTFGGVNKSITMLATGDLLAVCEDNEILCIEDKSPSDFLNSMRDGRLINQITRLRDVSKWSYLLIRGEFHRGPNGEVIAEGRPSGWNWASLSGMLTTIQELGVVVVNTTDLDYESCIIRLSSRDRNTMRVSPPRDAAIISEPDAIVASLPGIGVEKASKLLDQCKTVAGVLQVLTDLTVDPKIPGIAEGTRRKVRKALGIEEGYVLAEVHRDIHNVDDCLAFLAKAGFNIPETGIHQKGVLQTS